jgi:dTDP-4-amino-4,6-dideoxygalactose transaminase
MKVPFVDLKTQYLSIKTQIDQAIHTVIDNSSFIGGEVVKQFEVQFAKCIGVKHCIGVANGTDAIFIALKMLGIGPGDEVITVANSWISTSETISLVGAKPVFIDIEPDYFTIDPRRIEEKITKRTKAILPVHLYGQAVNMEEVRLLAERYNLLLIEDCAQAHLTEFKDQIAGTFGIAAAFSFYPGKNLGAYGDAGCIVTNDDLLAEKVRTFANHGALIKHKHVMEGVNSRLDGMQAAILSAKLPYLKEWTNLRISNAKLYSDLLRNIDLITVPKIREHSRHSFHLYVIRVRERDGLLRFLKSKDIDCLVHYPTILPLLAAYKHFELSKSDFPVASKYQDEIISLPLFPELSESQIIYVTEAINHFYRSR